MRVQRRRGKNSRWGRYKRGLGKLRRKRRENYLLEDEEHQRTFEGTTQETDDDKYFIMIMEGGEFKVIPVERKWLHFRAVQVVENEATAANTALLEKQLEQREKIKREQEDRFMQRYSLQLKTEGGETIESSSAASSSFGGGGGQPRRAARGRGGKKDDRDIDYDQNMSDDEDGMAGADDVHSEYLDAPSDDEDEELERRLAAEMGDGGKLTDTGKQMKDILKKLKNDPYALERALEEERARVAAAKAAADAARAAADEERAATGRKRKTTSPADAAPAASSAAAAAIPRETSIATIARPEPSAAQLEEPAAKKQRLTQEGAAAATQAAPAAGAASGAGAEPQLSDPNVLKDEVIKYLKQNGGNAPLKNVRKQFIPKSMFKTDQEKQAQVTLLVQVLKPISRSENQIVYLKAEYM